jgi:PTS system N-acetylglucosamine-specific IIC component
MKRVLASLQKVGGALMLPIAVLPIAGFLLRLGQPDLFDSASMAAAGSAIFDNLGLLFAVGVAVGLARENHGAAGLASVVAYLVATKGAEVLIGVPPEALAGESGRGRELTIAVYKAHELSKLSVPVGILSGLMAGALYNRFYNINLPSYLSFFGGRRFVPIVSGLGGLVLAILFGTQWQHLEQGMDAVSRSVLHAGAFGLFAYGVLNRLLIITGLHHIINNIAWFLLGDYHGVTGDLKRFFAGDPSAGAFMAGFFPVMMFGLPAACLAMYHSAPVERRRAVGGLLGSIALTSILTGVTEPIEFTFIFLAPALYVAHALLTGIAFIIMNALHVRLGFGFSAGVFDYVLNFSRATRPLWLLPVGAAYFALYYGLFRFVILRFDLKTPGRGRAESTAAAPPAAPLPRAAAWIEALGGSANLKSVDACTTRLRLIVASQSAVDAEALRRLGARGLVRPAAEALQVVVGTNADQLAGEMRTALQRAPAAPSGAAAGAATRTAASGGAASPYLGAITAQMSGEPWSGDAKALLAALGGHGNVRGVESAASRVRVGLGNATRVDRAALAALGLRGVAVPRPDCVHLIVGPAAAVAAAALRQLLNTRPIRSGPDDAVVQAGADEPR